MEAKTESRVPLWQVIVLFVFLICSIIVSVQLFNESAHIPILLAAVLASIMAVRAGIKYSELEESMAECIKSAAQAILIMLIIGIVIGIWILAGIVPSMIYYGLELLSPSFFLVAALLMCSVVSIMTGSSWSTIGTIGVALIGVGIGHGVPASMTAGAIVSGAYFGDKMSPLSETTNLSPAMAGTDIFSHIKHMAKTTTPAYIISIIVFTILGLQFREGSVDASTVNSYLECLSANFNISPIMLLPPVCVVLIVLLKVPAIPGLLAVAGLGAVFAIVFQGASPASIVVAAHSGFKIETGDAVIDQLLNRGGLGSMLDTVALILIALAFAGILDRSGMIRTVIEVLLKKAKTDRGVLVSAMATVLFCIFTTQAYVAMVVPGRMYREEFRKRCLHPVNLSRILEDVGTLCCPLCPWSTDGVYITATLGVATGSYWMFCILNLVNPIISLFCSWTGLTIKHITPEQAEQDVISL